MFRWHRAFIGWLWACARTKEVARRVHGGEHVTFFLFSSWLAVGGAVQLPFHGKCSLFIYPWFPPGTSG